MWDSLSLSICNLSLLLIPYSAFSDISRLQDTFNCFFIFFFLYMQWCRRDKCFSVLGKSMLAEVSGCNPSLGEQCDLNKLVLHSAKSCDCSWAFWPAKIFHKAIVWGFFKFSCCSSSDFTTLLKNKRSLLASLVSWWTINNLAAFPLHKRFFIEGTGSLDYWNVFHSWKKVTERYPWKKRKKKRKNNTWNAKASAKCINAMEC